MFSKKLCNEYVEQRAYRTSVRPSSLQSGATIINSIEMAGHSILLLAY